MSMVQRLATVFNVKKCKVLNKGHNNTYCDYSMNGEGLQSVTEKTDLASILLCQMT